MGGGRWWLARSQVGRRDIDAAEKQGNANGWHYIVLLLIYKLKILYFI